MISRRMFAAGALPALMATSAYFGLVHSGVWTALKRKLFSGSSCGSDCFSLDWKRSRYNEYFDSLFDLSRSSGFVAVATGPATREELREAFGNRNLHAAQRGTLQILKSEKLEDFTLHKVRFVLDCGFPVIGCAAVPSSACGDLVLLAHGMETTPELCFNLKSSDYMRAIGSRLCAAGFAVWCPFMPQAGNAPSQDNLAGMLSLSGISYHNIVCSALNLGSWVFAQLIAPQLFVKRFGMSWGSVITATLEAATSAGAPSVLSGYLRDEGLLARSSFVQERAGAPFLTYLHQLPGSENYFFPALADLLKPCPLYFEVGDSDPLNSIEFGRDAAFRIIKTAYRNVGAANAVTLRVFDGGHVVDGSLAIRWLKFQKGARFRISN